MNDSVLGDEGVVAVRSFFNRLGYIKPFINSDDTQPVWDGNLFVYNHRKDFTNDRLKFKVPVQVKAHEHFEEEFPDSTNYDVEIINLHNYYTDGGVVFLDVLVGPTRNQIYVNFLTKSAIKKLLDNARGIHTCRIKCKPIPRTYSEIVSQLRTLYLQRTHTLIPFEEVRKYDNVTWAIDSFGFEDNPNPLEFITSNPVNILAYLDGFQTPVYVGDSAAHISSVVCEEYFSVNVGDQHFFNSFKRNIEGTTQTIEIGKSLTLKFINEVDSRLEISINLNGNSVNEVIHELKFILAFFKCKQIIIGGKPLDLAIIVDEETINLFEGKLKFWSDVKDLFDILHIDIPLENPLNLSKKDINRINTLIAGILYGKTVVGKNGINKDHLEWISFANIRVLVYTKYISDNKYKIVNIFDNLISACYKDIDGKFKAASIYSKVISEDILANNVDWSNLVKSYQEALKENPDFYERANWDVLWLIKTYDKSLRPCVLQAAEELLTWIANTDKETSWHTVWKYNFFQIKIRKGESLSDEDKSWLYDEEDSIPSNKNLDDSQKRFSLFSIHVLLDNKIKAKKLFDKMSKDEQDFISGLPIYQLYKKLTTLYNG